MIVDLTSIAEPTTHDADVAVVGAGIAGLLLAHRLRSRGVRVIVVESGDAQHGEHANSLNEVVQSGRPYAGATLGRARGLGGTSTRWGGSLIPYLDEDLGRRPYVDQPGWAVSPSDLKQYLPDIERLFGMVATSYEEDLGEVLRSARTVPVGDADFRARYAKWPTFKLRNVATLLRRTVEGDSGLLVLLNATVTGFDIDAASGKVTGVEAQSFGGHHARITAGHFVFCAGAIESTRLLLLLDRQAGGAVFRDCQYPGTHLCDHLSVTTASIAASDPAALNRLAGFRFERGTMRSLRFELSPAAQRREAIGSVYAHIAVFSKTYGGYDALRDMLRELQARRRLSMMLAAKAMKDSGYLLKVGYWRYGRGQLHWPQLADYKLEVVAEQLPHAGNTITLADDRDRFGLPRARIDWNVRPADMAIFTTFDRLFAEFWGRQGLGRIGTLQWQVAPGSGAAPTLHSDSYHPTGMTRMGNDRRSAVVDADLRLFASPNLWVASTSTFPTGASANPTLTLMALSLRLADRLAGMVGDGR